MIELLTDNLRCSVFDIETTGLNSSRDIIISASFCNIDGTNLRQYFSENKESEVFLLKQIIDELNSFDAIVTYNGERFDIPFVSERILKNGLEYSFERIWNIDIYKYLKKYWDCADKMSSLSQMSVEYALGLEKHRTDKIKGADCISLYNDYQICGNNADKEKILLHNGDDVRQLARIAGSLSFLPYQRIIYENGYAIKPLSLSGKRVTLYVKRIIAASGGFSADISAAQNLDIESVFDDCLTVDYDSFSGALRVDINCLQLEEFQYIRLEDFGFDTDFLKNTQWLSDGCLILKKGENLHYSEILSVLNHILERVIK